MSATVYIPTTLHTPGGESDFIARECPTANHAYVTKDGHLVLHTGTDAYSSMAGYFQRWDHVVIEQRWLKGPDGRFVSKENR